MKVYSSGQVVFDDPGEFLTVATAFGEPVAFGHFLPEYAVGVRTFYAGWLPGSPLVMQWDSEPFQHG